jgi:hypothetical protein
MPISTRKFLLWHSQKKSGNIKSGKSGGCGMNRMKKWCMRMSEGLKMNGKEEKYFSFSCMPTTQRRRR